MKTTAWSVALMAGGAMAVPGLNARGDTWGDNSGWGNKPNGYGGWSDTWSESSWGPSTTSLSSTSSAWTSATTSSWTSPSTSSTSTHTSSSSTSTSSTSSSTSTSSSSTSKSSSSTSTSVKTSSSPVSPVTESSATSSSYHDTWSVPSSSSTSVSTSKSSSKITTSTSVSTTSTSVKTSSSPVSPVTQSSSTASSYHDTWSIPSSSSTSSSTSKSSSKITTSTSVSTPPSTSVKTSSSPVSPVTQSSSTASSHSDTWAHTWSVPSSASSSTSVPVTGHSSVPSSSPVSPVTPSSSTTKTSASSSFTSSVSKNSTSSSWAGTWTGTWSPPKSTVTKYTTIFTTVCPATSTYVTGGTTGTSTWVTGGKTTTGAITTGATTVVTTYITTSTVTSVWSSTVPVVPVPTGGSSSWVKTTTSDITTVYTTVCPVTTTAVSGSTTKTSTYHTTSTVTSVYKSTITVTVPAGPTKPASSSSVPPVVVITQKTTVFTTVPVVPVPTSSSPVGADSTPVTKVTKVTTVYTTVCPVTTTSVSGSTTLTSVSKATSTITSVYDSTTVILPTTVPWTEIPWGTTTFSYALTTPVISSSSSYTGVTNGTATKKHHHHHKPSKSAKTGSVGTTSKKPIGSVTSKSTGTAPVSKSTGTAPVSKSTGTAPISKKPSGTATSATSTTSTKSLLSTYSAKPSETCIPCEGQPGSDPNAWCGYTVHDNSYKVMPKTCKTVEYDFTITNTTFAPDGVSRLGLLVNGQMPGPKIEANWGDTIVVRVHNAMQNNGTSIHFHGTRQNYTNEMDGVPSITQCPLAPGETQTYTFKATNYGTAWWHSHIAMQLYDGVFGPMVIHGPASATYDEEEFIVLQDWNHVSLNTLYDMSQDVNAPGNGPQVLDTGLLNGKNVWQGAGERYSLSVVSGKTYRLRLVNSAIQTSFKFYLDQHTFQVIANDYVPIVPYSTTVLNINVGERYDVIFKADQPVGNYWLRADGQQTCTQLKNSKDIKGIVSYVGASAGAPTSTAYSYTEDCVDEPLASLVPVVPLSAGPQQDLIHETVVIGANGGTPNLWKWTLSGTTFQSQYGDPTLVSVYNNGTIPDYSGSLAIEVPDLNEWVYVIIESPIPLPHPIHLHGHDIMVLAQGYGSYSSSVPLNLATPARRDTALLPGSKGQGGYLVVAFQTDNPGAWLMHCHIGWHASMGFALQIIENEAGIKDTVAEGDKLNAQCANWSSFAAQDGIVVADAGI